MEEHDKSLISNGWTQYQKLVLSELTRHENALNNLQKDIADLRLSMAKLEIQLVGGFLNINNNIAEMKSSGDKAESDIKTLDKARETQSLSLTAIQWKITAFATGISSVLAILLELILKKYLA